MGRELVISCDRCRFELEKMSSGAPRTVGVDGKSFVLDLCDSCDADVLGALRQLTTDYGMPLEQVTPAPTAAPKKKRGRPPGSKNKSTIAAQAAAAAPSAGPTVLPAAATRVAATAGGPQAHRFRKGVTTPSQIVETGRGRGRSMGPLQMAVSFPTKCLWCPKNLFTSGEIGTHMRTVHGFESTHDAWGHDCPLCGKGDFGRLANHILSQHTMLITDAVRAALDAGDQYGYARKIMDSIGAKQAS